MNKKQKLAKYLNGVGGVLKELSKEVNKKGIDKESLELMQKIGSDLLFKGTAMDYTESPKVKNKIHCPDCCKEVKQNELLIGIGGCVYCPMNESMTRELTEEEKNEKMKKTKEEIRSINRVDKKRRSVKL